VSNRALAWRCSRIPSSICAVKKSLPTVRFAKSNACLMHLATGLGQTDGFRRSRVQLQNPEGDSLSHLRWLIPPVILALAWLAPRLGNPWISSFERLATQFAARKTTVLITLALAVIFGRLALLREFPEPVPNTHDEFSYLLAGDTFAHGRLTNSPHPMSLFFETFHVLQHPTYQSVYPPAQGGVLALGQLFGDPWIGVLLSVAGMTVAITWMLQQWLPPQWALLGGVLVILRIDLFSYWLDGYWGGAVAASGGALVVGAMPGIVKRHSSGSALLMGLGAALLANTRPLEGLIFCIPVGVWMIAWLCSRSNPGLPTATRRVLLPLLGVLSLTLVFVSYYNWRVTGDAFTMPRALYQRERLNFPVFVWQSPQPPLHYSNPQFDGFYNIATRQEYSLPWTRLTRKKLHGFWQFYLGSVLWLPLVAFPWVLRDRRTRFLLLQFCFCAFGLLLVVYFIEHYAAPLTATFFGLLIQSMRHLRRWEIQSRPVGIFLTRLVVLLVLARVVIYIGHPPALQEPWSLSRARLVKQLEGAPNKHLVLVHYAPDHNVHHEWVFNAADIDHSKIVWARDIPGVDLKPLLEYFHDRTVWTIDPDGNDVRLHPYVGRAFP
jgi:hypothetical protein